MADVLARHPTLRARLTMRDGQLLQEVLAPDGVSIRVVGVDGPTAQARLDAAIALLRDGGRNPIDVVAGPPLVVRLVRLEPDDHILCFYVHHAMCDGWSSQIIIRDLAACYEARCHDRVAQLPSLAEQFSDWAEWQIRTYESGGFEDEIRYWKAELADLPSALVLPATGTRKGNRDFTASSPVYAESAAIWMAVQETARRSRVSAFSLILANLAVLLHQRTGADDLIIGVPTLNRWSTKSMEFVGCATSLLPARIRLRAAMPFEELCRQAHATVRRLLAYGRIPLEVILRETQESPLGGPVFPVWCQIRQEAPPIRIESVGLLLRSLLIERGTLLADLDVDMLTSEDGFRCEFAHRPSLFDRTLIEALMADFGTILRAAAREPGTLVSELSRRGCADVHSG